MPFLMHAPAARGWRAGYPCHAHFACRMPFQCGCKAQCPGTASGRPAGTQKGGGMPSAAHLPGHTRPYNALYTQVLPQYAAAPLRHSPRRASARTRLMRRDAARVLALGPAPCTPRPHPMICSRGPPARALMQRPAQKRRLYAGKQAPPCRKLFGPRPRLPGKAVFRHAHKTHFLPPAPCPVIRKKPGRCAARLHMVLTA